MTRRFSLAHLYGMAPRPVQAVGVAAMGAYLEWQRHGGSFAEMLHEAEATTFATRAQLAEVRERVWDERMRRALAGVAAYGRRELALRQASELPILTKQQVREHAADYVAPHVRPWQRMSLRTSGSTGSSLRLYASRAAVRRSYAFTWRYRRWHGIERGEWCAMFAGRAVLAHDRREPPFWQTNPVGRTTLYSQYHLDERTVRAYVEHLRSTKVRWIHGYPSFLSLLSQLACDAGLAGSTDVRWVTVSSESLLEPQRRAIVQMFGVEPRQQYGTTESVAMMSECPEGRLHVDEDYSWVEFVPSAEDPGRHRIVGTSIDNDAFPLLRYDVGDLVELAHDACPCGRQGRVVAAIDGRREDFVVLADGSRVGRVSSVFMGATNVTEAQIVQHRAGEAVFRIVRAPDYGPDDEASLRVEAADRFGERLLIDFEYVTALPRTSNGKLRLVVSHIPDARLVP